MKVITLISDMGNEDHYLASLKGAIYSELNDVSIVDISHNIMPFDIGEAGFILKNCYPDFPKGTVHILGINADATEEHRHVIAQFEGQYFIGADNGIFSFVFDRIPDAIFELNIASTSDRLTFPMKDTFVKAACHLARGGTPEVIGKKIESLYQAEPVRPVVENDEIRGHVRYIDNYGNAVTNIDEKLFNQTAKDRSFIIQLRKASFDIRKIHNHYTNVPEGEKVAIFNSSNLLEIAINKGAPGNGGGAAQLFGLKKKDIIRIIFNASSNR